MPILLRLASLGVLAGALTGCLSEGSPYAAADGSVNPAPVPGYRVGCSITPGLTNPLFASYYAHCAPTVGPFEHRAVVRAKG